MGRVQALELGLWVASHCPPSPLALDNGAVTWGDPSWKILCCLDSFPPAETIAFPSSFTPLHPKRAAAWRPHKPSLKRLPPRSDWCNVGHRALLGRVTWRHLPHPCSAATASAVPGSSSFPQSHLSRGRGRRANNTPSHPRSV